MENEIVYLLCVGVAALIGAGLFVAFVFRRVVPTNEVHIVQYGSESVSYGRNESAGNVYYKWPSWVPRYGVVTSYLPISIFPIELEDYEAYDKGRLPFVIDVNAFYRISDSNVAAQRVSSASELYKQLTVILKGAIRTVLAKSDIESIMEDRAIFGEEFTKEVEEQLKNWGVSTVKNVELMDIRDSKGSHVISNIMAKKKSYIEKESRVEVAKNTRAAEIAEIEAERDTDMQRQDAEKEVGLRTVDNQRAVALAKEAMDQQVREQQALTAEKDKAVRRVEVIREAEIARDQGVVKAQQEKEMQVLRAEGELEQERRQAEAIKLKGEAEADAEKLMLLAPVEAQLKLADGIKENEAYQNYLMAVEKIKADKDVGLKQAEALDKASIKIIANTDTPSTGISDVSKLFSSKGGQAVGSMLEGFLNTEAGVAVAKKAGLGKAKIYDEPSVEH